MINREKKECSGCGICEFVCPTKAITMCRDQEGFLYPMIDSKLCINCGKCEETCGFNDLLGAEETVMSYAARHKDDDVCRNSTSGGMFTAISDVILDKGGAIYAPSFDEKMYLTHCRILRKDLRDNARGSKYVQSEPNGFHKELFNDLKQGIKVAFFGTPCQVAGVLRIIPRQYKNNFYTIDIICNGVSSPLLWGKHVERVEKKYHKKMKNYNFRPKSEGNHTDFEIAEFTNRTTEKITHALEKYNSLYYRGLAMRPSCTNCAFCSTKRIADITIADLSKVNSKQAGFDISKGVSTLLVNTEQGERLYEDFKKNIIATRLPMEEIDQIRLHQCSEENDNSKEFLRRCKENSLEKAIHLEYGSFRKLRFDISECIYRLRK